MRTLQEIRKRLIDKEKRKQAEQKQSQITAQNKADKIISEDFYGFDDSICVKIIKEVTRENADDIKRWLHKNCKGKFTYSSRWRQDNNNVRYSNFYFESKNDAMSFKMIWG